MRKILNLLLSELTNNLVNRHTKRQSKRKNTRKTFQAERVTPLDRQLQELAEVFIPDKSSIRNKSRNAEPPTLPQENEYWSELSTWYRKQKGWTCEQCRLNLRKDKQYLDTHHMLGRGHNSPEHLKALCVGCHAKQKTPSDHSFMKDSKRYWLFVRTYRKRR